MEIIEIIVMVGVIWNAILQTIWFIWSIKTHHQKHNEDENSELMTNSTTDYEPKFKSRDEVLNAERKYDPNKIKGMFDSVFEEK
jgi:hypothetical protein